MYLSTKDHLWTPPEDTENILLNTLPTIPGVNLLRVCTHPSSSAGEFPFAEPTGVMDFMKMG